MEKIKINGHEITGADINAIADKILAGKTTYESLPWMKILQADLAERTSDGSARDQALLQLLSEEGHPYHFGFLSSKKYDQKEFQRLQDSIK